jgi:hypothetical protein
VSEIERKECPEHGAAYGWDNDGALVKCIHCGADLSRTKYAPAEQLRGAVEERDRLRAENERLREALAHVINRVSTERRDDEHGHIFAVGKAALVRTNDDVPSVPELVERSRALGPVMEAQGERVAQGLREAADRMRGGE